MIYDLAGVLAGKPLKGLSIYNIIDSYETFFKKVIG